MFDTSFIDFDNTLYNTHHAVQDMFRILTARGISQKDAEESLDHAVHGESGQYFDYTFDRHLFLLRERGYRFSTDELLAELSGLLRTSYQEPDAEVFLQQLRDRSERLVLLTAGNETFQRQKIASTTLGHYFDDVHVLHEKKDTYVEHVADPTKTHLFVNDNIRENVAVHARCPNVVVVTKRHPVRYTDEELRVTNIPCFNSLTEIMSYVEHYAV